MEFLNEQIKAGSIPEIQNIVWQPVERNYLKIIRIQLLIFSAVLLLVAVALLFFIPELQKPFLIILLAGGWILICWIVFLLQEKLFHSLAFCIREHDVIYRRGWIIKKIIACPFSRIQHCNVSAGPLDRKYGLSSLTLYTAGVEDGGLTIPGLNEGVAQRLRDFIITKIKNSE